MDRRVQPEAGDVLASIDEFFMRTGPVHRTLDRLALRLSKHHIDYAVIGGMALALHGFVRPTQDIHVLLSRDGLVRFREDLVGLGYVRAFEGAEKAFRDTETGVKIEIITAGEYPGDGRPKAVVFPEPAAVSVVREGVKVVDLPKLVELKLASGLMAAHRLRDLADVQELILRLALPEEFASLLEESVRDEFTRLWQSVKVGREADAALNERF